MIKWFYRWLDNKLQNSRYAENEAEPTAYNTISGKQAMIRPSRLREGDDLASEPVQFKMYKASGGWAIEFRQYDRKRDTVDTSLYVVNDEQELGKHISQIITMEALKR